MRHIEVYPINFVYQHHTYEAEVVGSIRSVFEVLLMTVQVIVGGIWVKASRCPTSG